MNQTKVSIVIPAYNEEEALKDTIEKMVGMGIHKKYEVILVDDGSTDKTLEIMKNSPFTVYHHFMNKGYGASLKTGIRKSSGDKVVIMDSDGQHDPASIPQIIELLENSDMVIGERSKASFQVANRTLGKRIIRKVGEYLVEQKLPDFNSGFRGFDRKLITEMLHIMPNGFSFSTTSTLAFLKEGYNIATFPIEVAERVGRKSNVRFFKDGSKTILLLFRIIMLFNPLKIFFPISLLSFFGGTAFGTYGYFIFGRFSNGGMILMIFGMFMFFIGLLADQISIMNRKKS